MIVPKISRLMYGADYNPEQWVEEVWRDDVRLMREAGVTMVSLGIFSWAQLEPRPGVYDFAWLDRVIDLLHTSGVMVDLATATASPPPWLAHRHPESLPVTADGTTLWPGGRQHYCPSSVAYRAAASALVRRLAERYRSHPALALWHINNEYGCHVAQCYCDASAAAFRLWLQRRYGALECLNEAWGTAFWSQRYDQWEEINPPRLAPTFPNPTHQLDFRRFSSDALLELCEMERAILREVTPEIPVTTNFMGFFKPIDYWRWAAHEDLVSNDSYPDPADPQAHVDQAMTCDLMRSLGGGRPWLLMEQTPSAVNWRTRNAPKRPGQMRVWSMQAVARGADGVMFFQWRASKAGAEKFHGAMVPHAGTDTRVWREVVALGSDLARLEALRDTRVSAEVAILFDWESWWALEVDSKPSSDVRLLEQVQCYYRALYSRNIPVDFVSTASDLSGYRLLLVPNLYLVEAPLAARLEQFVEAGGALAISFFSGIVDADEHIYLGGYPAPFRRLLGLRIEEFDPYALGQTRRIATTGGPSYTCDLWSDRITLEGAAAIATYEGGDDDGHPAVTRHAFGRGVAYYLGTRPDDAYMDVLLCDLCREAEVAPGPEASAGVESVRRSGPTGSFLFLLNQTDAPAEAALLHPGHDLLTGRRHEGRLSLAPREVVVLEEECYSAR